MASPTVELKRFLVGRRSPPSSPPFAPFLKVAFRNVPATRPPAGGAHTRGHNTPSVPMFFYCKKSLQVPALGVCVVAQRPHITTSPPIVISALHVQRDVRGEGQNPESERLGCARERVHGCTLQRQRHRQTRTPATVRASATHGLSLSLATPHTHTHSHTHTHPPTSTHPPPRLSVPVTAAAAAQIARQAHHHKKKVAATTTLGRPGASLHQCCTGRPQGWCSSSDLRGGQRRARHRPRG